MTAEAASLGAAALLHRGGGGLRRRALRSETALPCLDMPKGSSEIGWRAELMVFSGQRQNGKNDRTCPSYQGSCRGTRLWDPLLETMPTQGVRSQLSSPRTFCRVSSLSSPPPSTAALCLLPSQTSTCCWPLEDLWAWVHALAAFLSHPGCKPQPHHSPGPRRDRVPGSHPSH